MSASSMSFSYRMGDVPYGGPPPTMYFGPYAWVEHKLDSFKWTPANSSWKPDESNNYAIFQEGGQLTVFIKYWYTETKATFSEYIVSSGDNLTSNKLVYFLENAIKDEAHYRETMTSPNGQELLFTIHNRNPGIVSKLTNPNAKITGHDMWSKMTKLKKLSIATKPLKAVCVEFTW